MAKTKVKKTRVSEGAVWLITLLTLAISCAAMSVLISENRELQHELNTTLVSQR